MPVMPIQVLLFTLDLSSYRNLRHNHQAILYILDVYLFAFVFDSWATQADLKHYTPERQNACYQLFRNAVRSRV